MAIEIYFRGVAMFVCGPGNKTVAKVLLPNAEQDPIDKKTDRNGGVAHADNTRAIRHFAGLLIPRPDGDEYRRLRGLDVKFVVDNDDGDATIDEGFITQIPSIKRATNGEGFELALLPSKEETPSARGRVITRIRALGGHLSALDPGEAPRFSIDGHHAKDKKDIPPQQYAPAVVWRPRTAAKSVTIALADPSEPDSDPIRITLDEKRPTAFFYNFEHGLPTKAQLEHQGFDTPCNGHLVDHDFKWLYKLMDRTNEELHDWPRWLSRFGGVFHDFPAPKSPCHEVNIALPSVSTCFQTVLEDGK